ncbi:hypothetical protein [Paludibacterium denitrificans]|uniref:Uncharacterized protein n=1 Tax=Paludibacterium denitrificans TaxID=2675226 RepID=A0A844GAU4_9NEIS|nr:hypothetical protein [Paludibacterium denitrificans]MTD33586.1 hypothetical protein [Paludibacterium denitrificans]
MIAPLRKKSHIFLLAWLSAAVLASAIWGVLEYRRLQGEFERSARLAHGMVARKLDQNESVLSAIDAFQSSRPDLNLGALRTFSRQMIAHYPQLYTVEFFQHVTRQSR